MPEMKTMFSFGTPKSASASGLGEDRVVAAARAVADFWSDTKSFRVSWITSAFSRGKRGERRGRRAGAG